MKTKSIGRRAAAGMLRPVLAGAIFWGGAVLPAAAGNAKPALVVTEAWPVATVPATAGVRPAPTVIMVPATSPATAGQAALEQHTQGKIIEKFHADNLDLKTALALFASQNDLNIVPDNDIAGTVTLDVHNLPLDQMMTALLEAGDCSWHEDHGLIRVRNTETRTFAVDYLRLKRDGIGNSSATLNPATASGGGSGGGSSGSGSTGGSSVNVTADNATDFWTELRAELSLILTSEGKNSMAINKTAGLIQITDRPSALKKAEDYLNATEQCINRQVDIEIKIYDVTLNDAFQFGIDWNHVASAYAGSIGFGTTTLPVAIGSGSALGNSSLGGLTTSPAGGITSSLNSLVFSNMNTSAAITALKTQGNVQVVAAPRIRTLNNQTALVKVGEELPFFAQNTINSQSAGGNQVSSGDTVTTVTVGTILSITPQISQDGWIAMDISPVLTSLVQIDTSPGAGTATAPVLSDKQASTLARVRNDTTVVLGGLIQTEKDQNDTKVPVLGDVPWLGRLFTGTYHAKTKNELVIFVTPHIVESDERSVTYHGDAPQGKD